MGGQVLAYPMQSDPRSTENCIAYNDINGGAGPLEGCFWSTTFRFPVGDFGHFLDPLFVRIALKAEIAK